MKETKYLTYKKNLEKKIYQFGGGNQSIDIKKSQIELLKIKKKIDNIKKYSNNTNIDAYNKLKPLIDPINLKLTNIDNQINSLKPINSKQTDKIINQIEDINILLENTGANYTNINTDKTIKFMKEKIEPTLAAGVYDKYIHDTQELVSKLKIQIGNGSVNGSLIDNEDIYKNIKAIDTKIEEYEREISPIDSLKESITKYITEMESLLNFKIDKFQPISTKELDKIYIQPIESKNIDFSYFEPNEYQDSDTDQIHTPDFLQTKQIPLKESTTKKYQHYSSKYSFEPTNLNMVIKPTELNDTMSKLYVNWRTKLLKINKQNKDILIFANIKNKLENDSKKNKSILEYIISIQNEFSKQSIIDHIINEKISNLLNKIAKNLSIIDIIMKECTGVVENFKTTKIFDKENAEKVCKYDNFLLEDKTELEEIIKLVEKKILDLTQNNIIDGKKDIVSKLTESITNINKIINIQEGGSNTSKEVRPKEVSNTFKIGDGKMTLFINKLNDFEKVIRGMTQKRKEIIKIIKIYNVRYTQFYNFQKYIVNYVSLTLAQNSYEYYNYLTKGTISFYDSILDRMEKIIDKYENPKSFDDSLKNPENQLLYGRHYFMIKILRRFFNDLYNYWDSQYEKNKELWSIDKKIDLECTNGNGSENKKYFFLFNIFFKILDAFHMKLPPVANYLRINKIDPGEIRSITFEKDNKHHIKSDNVQSCNELPNDGYKVAKIDATKNIQFEEIFDPDNFKENENLSLYMGLSNSLSARKSIMLLTYGYSGVGKTFTLFGNSAKEGRSANGGLLQTTLKNITNTEKIEMKAFELYGLGVPYKFYWQKESIKFDHRIYSYKLIGEETVVDPNTNEIKPEGFDNFLNIKNDYILINQKQIDNFSAITNNIDEIRKTNGRIRKTLNNPESSRSIMIYDFKITFPSLDNYNNECRFVIMDLPGKENLYQTYCSSVDLKNDEYRPKDIFYKHRKGPIDPKKNSRPLNTEYNINLIKSMMYINPLWLATIPEIAEHFDTDFNGDAHLGTKDLSTNIITKAIYVLDNKSGTETLNKRELYEKFYQSQNGKIKDINFEIYFKETVSNAHKQTSLVGNEPSKWGGITSGDNRDTNIGLYGMFERAFSNILNLIQNSEGNSDLFKLGEKLNNMLPDTTPKQKKYGYAGLEGVYINENILGLLEVLSEKIQNDRGKTDKVHVVCPQIEIYKKLYLKTKTPISYELLQKLGSITDKNEIIPGSRIFIEDDEFYSQIKFLREYAKLKITAEGDTENSFFKATSEDKYNTKMRDPSEDYKEKGILQNIEDSTKNWVNNYDYNSIFNRENPPIKSILKNYLEDSSFKNFYLFFVVSNNLKIEKDTLKKTDTCDKQIQLLFDTRDFMEVIANENAPGKKCNV